MEHSQFYTYKNYFGPIADDGDGSIIYGFENVSQSRPNYIDVPTLGGCFGYVDMGTMHIKLPDGKELIVSPGWWFTTPDGFKAIASGTFRVVVFQRQEFAGTYSMGKLEDSGRLKYIDGCTDSILYSPIRFGDPCLNALYMPEGVNQTMHTHPSTRAGFIITGGAKCETPESEHLLEAGMIFFLPKNGLHKFRSDFGEDITMKLVAYHPDSDFGPRDEEHPMLNRTIVGDISAKHIPEIQTK